MEVEIISKELIKPSCFTPDHLRYHQLSFLDQWLPRMFIPIIFFYPKSSTFTNTKRCDILKKSLLEALTLFYPLAGRIKHNSYIDCNDEGLLFVTAKSNTHLSTVLSDRNADINNNFVPAKANEIHDLAGFCQITLFDCGGLAVSFAMSHKLGDGVSTFTFMKSWIAISNGDTNIKAPRFGFSTLFPPVVNLPDFEPTILDEKLVTKFFAFSASAVAALKAKYAANYGEKLSSVEALSVFIWSRFVASTQSKDCKKKRYKAYQWVNLRPRMQLPETNISIGNLVTIAEVEANMDDENDECYGMVKRMKDSVRKVNSTSIRKLQNNEQHLKVLNGMREDVDCFNFSSLCNLSAYESDFGWGKPLFLGICPHIFKNSVFFCDTKEGTGLDAWIALKEDDMAKFETDDQLLAHLSSTRFSRM